MMGLDSTLPPIRIDRDVTVHDYIPGQPIPMLIRDRESGKIYANPLKKWVKPFVLAMEPEELTLTAAGTIGSKSEPIPLQIDNKGHFEIIDAFFSSQRAAGFTVLLQDANNRPILMNREIHVASFASGGGVTTNAGALGTAGSAGRPFRWPESFWMNVEEHGTAIFAVFRNLSSQSNKIRFALGGLRWYCLQAPPRVADRMKEIYRARFRTMPYFFTTDEFVSLSGGASDKFQVRFGDEAWTEITKLMAFSTAFDVSGTANDFDVRISEFTTKKRYMSELISRQLVFGNGEFPMLLWESSLFEPGYRLLFELKNNSQSTNTIWITMGCRKIFPDPKEDVLVRP